MRKSAFWYRLGVRTVHNRYLPEWVHRIVNAFVVALVWGIATGYLWVAATPGSLWRTIVGCASLLTPVVLVAMLFVGGSVVRCVAGEVGYDELD